VTDRELAVAYDQKLADAEARLVVLEAERERMREALATNELNDGRWGSRIRLSEWRVGAVRRDRALSRTTVVMPPGDTETGG